MKTFDYHPQKPVDALYNDAEYLVDYAEIAHLSMTEKQRIAKSYRIYNNTRKFDYAITECNQRPLVEKTWINIKVHFCIVHKELRESSILSITKSDIVSNNSNIFQQVVEGVKSILIPPNKNYLTTKILQEIVKYNNINSTIQ